MEGRELPRGDGEFQVVISSIIMCMVGGWVHAFLCLVSSYMLCMGQ